MVLSDVAKQVEFSELVGVSQQAISKMVSAGVLVKGDSYQMWLRCYCTRLRDEAAGRQASETRLQLDQAKTREAIASARTKELALFREEKLILDRTQVKDAMEAWVSLARSEYMNSIDKIIAAIESQHGVVIDRDQINGITDAACRVIGDFSIKSCGSD